MTSAQSIKQAAAYRAAAKTYEAAGDTFVAEALRDLANRIDAINAARK